MALAIVLNLLFALLFVGSWAGVVRLVHRSTGGGTLDRAPRSAGQEADVGVRARTAAERRVGSNGTLNPSRSLPCPSIT